jgi:hypothetical protein
MTSNEMADKITIEMIGPGCPFCKRLYQRVREVVAEQGMDADMVHVTDLKTVLRYIPFKPVLKVSGRIVHRGKRLPGKDKLCELIRSGAGPEERRSQGVAPDGV